MMKRQDSKLKSERVERFLMTGCSNEFFFFILPFVSMLQFHIFKRRPFTNRSQKKLCVKEPQFNSFSSVNLSFLFCSPCPSYSQAQRSHNSSQQHRWNVQHVLRIMTWTIEQLNPSPTLLHPPSLFSPIFSFLAYNYFFPFFFFFFPPPPVVLLWLVPAPVVVVTASISTSLSSSPWVAAAAAEVDVEVSKTELVIGTGRLAMALEISFWKVSNRFRMTVDLVLYFRVWEEKGGGRREEQIQKKENRIRWSGTGRKREQRMRKKDEETDRDGKGLRRRL